MVASGEDGKPNHSHLMNRHPQRKVGRLHQACLWLEFRLARHILISNGVQHWQNEAFHWLHGCNNVLTEVLAAASAIRTGVKLWSGTSERRNCGPQHQCSMHWENVTARSCTSRALSHSGQWMFARLKRCGPATFQPRIDGNSCGKPWEFLSRPAPIIPKCMVNHGSLGIPPVWWSWAFAMTAWYW